MGEFAIRIIFDRKKIARRDASKVAPITIEVREVGTNKKVPLDTHVKIKASEYSKNYGFTIKNRPDARELKIEVLKIYNRVEEFINSPQCLSLEDFRTWKNKGATPKTTFIDFFKFYMDLHHHSYATREHYQSLLTRLEQFGKIIEFKDLTYSNIADFDSFLRKTCI